MQQRTSGIETCIGLFILAVLVVIGMSILATQNRYDPALFKALAVKGEAVPARQSQTSAPQGPSAASLAPAGLVAMGGEETFDSNTLSDKIDGKAELYLSSGFVRLTTQRFSKASDPKSWLELFVYDMDGPANAFSVYSVQKRSDARDVGLGPAAYGTENALFLVSGSKYIEIVSSDTGLGKEMSALAAKFAEEQPSQAGGTVETAGLFPTESLDPASISLHMSDVFGFSGLDRVFTAKYKVGQEQVTAFLSKRKSAREAVALAAAYGRFLLENGGSELGEVPGVPGSRLYQVFDTFEAVVQKGAFLAGAHEVETRISAEKVAAALYRKLQDDGK